MSPTEGYRVSRLKRRRRGAAERWQIWVLYVLAAAVAFAAVLGAWYAAGLLVGGEEGQAAPGLVSVIELTGEEGEPVAAAVLIHDPEGDGTSLHVVPPELLLEGPEGAYVFAADSLRMGTLKSDLQRLLRTDIESVHTLPAAELGELVAAEELRLSPPRPLEVDVAGAVREVTDGDAVPVADLGEWFSAESTGGGESAELQAALWFAVAEAAALRSADVRARLSRELAGAPGDGDAAAGADEAGRFADALVGLDLGRSSDAGCLVRGRMLGLPRTLALVLAERGLVNEEVRSAGRALADARRLQGAQRFDEWVDVTLPFTPAEARAMLCFAADPAVRAADVSPCRPLSCTQVVRLVDVLCQQLKRNTG